MAQAGSQAAFRLVDHDAQLAVFDWARRGGARHAALVSSVGADESSGNFYLRVKGEVERQVAARDFDSFQILRPGLLLGHRSERRTVERVARMIMPVVNPLLVGALARYRAVPAPVVAAALVNALFVAQPGLAILNNREIEALAGLDAQH
jgi:uncharacterized protein YbjT (DUF2867 family)